MVLLAQAADLSGGVRQAILGVVFDLFKSKDEAYKVFFLVSAAIHAASAFLYLVVHQKQKEARELTEREKERRNGGGRRAITCHQTQQKSEHSRNVADQPCSDLVQMVFGEAHERNRGNRPLSRQRPRPEFAGPYVLCPAAG